MKNEIPTAFPWTHGDVTCTGMGLRDYFAAKAMEGSRSRNSRYETWDALAKDAYEIADAMLRAREAE
jgi:hypothetical protein